MSLINTVRRRAVAGTIAAAVLVVPLAVTSTVAAQGAPPDRPAFTLTILHNNDGESRLTGAPGQPDFGCLARFATLVDDLRDEATTGKPAAGQAGRRGVILLSSGDNFLAGPEWQASLDKGVPFYDSLALSRIGYDAMAIGNHEFDFGPDVLADFIESFGADRPPFVSANLDVSDEPRLAALADDGTIVASTVVRERGERIGVVGATTPLLRAISSPRNVKVLEDVAGLVQDQVDELTAVRVNKIVLISHLQNINEDLELIPMLSGVDVAIAGGGDELLANDDDLLVPGDVRATDPATGQPLTYPLFASNADGADVPIVTTAGDYKYVGRLVVEFDKAGNVTGVDPISGPVRVAGGDYPDAVAPDPQVQAQVVEPVIAYVADLAANVIATSEVALEGRRGPVPPGVRTAETNLGNLLADALLWQANQLAASFGVAPADVALQNGGGIRNNNIIEAGPITELTTFDILPFANFIAAVPDFTAQQLKDVLERAYSNVENADGAFAHVSNLIVEVDLSQPAQEADVDDEGNVTITAPGQRVRNLTIAGDGTELVVDGVVQQDAPAFILASIDFSIRNGDAYPFNLDEDGFTLLGTSYQQSLSQYIQANTDGGGLGGVISAEQYPVGGDGRITITGSAE